MQLATIGPPTRGTPCVASQRRAPWTTKRWPISLGLRSLKSRTSFPSSTAPCRLGIGEDTLDTRGGRQSGKFKSSNLPQDNQTINTNFTFALLRRAWRAETVYSMRTQRILRRHRVVCWDGQERDDFLLLLKLRGHQRGAMTLSWDEIHAHMARVFGAAWTRTPQEAFRYGGEGIFGSFDWVMSRDEGGLWMTRRLQRCGPWVGFDRATGARGFDLRRALAR